jgi:hypothetical protein
LECGSLLPLSIYVTVNGLIERNNRAVRVTDSTVGITERIIKAVASHRTRKGYDPGVGFPSKGIRRYRQEMISEGEARYEYGEIAAGDD